MSVRQRTLAAQSLKLGRWPRIPAEVSGGCCAAPTGRRPVTTRIAATKAFLEQKFHLPVESVAEGGDTQGGVMTTLQAICLGAMLAWTPSLIVLAFLLRKVPLDELDELQRDPS